MRERTLRFHVIDATGGKVFVTPSESRARNLASKIGGHYSKEWVDVQTQRTG